MKMQQSRKNITNECHLQQIGVNSNSKKINFSESVNSLLTGLSKLMQNVMRFRREHSDPKKQYSPLVLNYITVNYFQMKLISIKDYIQFKKDFIQILSTVHSVSQEIKNCKYTQKDTQFQFIKDFINQLKDLQELIRKCQKLISSEKTKNDIEKQSKIKSTQHLNELLTILEQNKNQMSKFQQTLKKDEQIKINNYDPITQNQKSKSHKIIKEINQEILKNILNSMSSFKSPKQTTSYNTYYTSPHKQQFQNLPIYKDLKQNVESMLKQTENQTQSQPSLQKMRDCYTFMLNKIIDCLKKIEELQAYKQKCTVSEKQITNHLDQISGELLTIKQNLQKEMSQKINQQQVSTILRSTQEINLNLQKTLMKYQDSKNVQTTKVYVELKDLYQMNQKNILIEKSMIKIHQILKNQEKQLKKNQINTFEQGKNQSEDQNHAEHTTKVLCVYSQQQMEEKIRQKLNEQTVKMEDAHKREIERLNHEFENLKNGFETKIKQLQTQLVKKDSQIYQLNQKKQRQQNENNLQKRQSIKQAQFDKQHLQRQEEMKNALTSEVNEKRDEKNKLIGEVNELNKKIKNLNDKVKQLSSSEAAVVVSIDQKTIQLFNLEQQIKNLTEAKNNKNQSLTKNTNSIKMKVENQEQIIKITFESFQLNSKLQNEKGKNQANQKQIASLKESFTKLTDQKIALKLEMQRMKIQFQNLLKQEINLKQQVKRLEEKHKTTIKNIYDETQRKSIEAAKIYREKQKKLIEQLQKIKTIKKQPEQKLKQFNQQQDSYLGSWLDDQSFVKEYNGNQF